MSNRIIKPGAGVEIKQFTPPVQHNAAPVRRQYAQASGGELPADAPHGSDGENDTARCRFDIIENADKEARRILSKASRIISDIRGEAEIEAENLKKTAVAEGYREGYERGIREGMEKAEREQAEFMKQRNDKFRKDVELAFASIDKAKETCLRTHLDELKDCSVAIAEKVIHISLKSCGEVIKRMLIAETEKLKKKAWVKIYIEKTDYDMMIETDAYMANELAKLSDNIKFIVMDKENSGNCIIEMPDEIVDISVDTQMENIREILENIRF